MLLRRVIEFRPITQSLTITRFVCILQVHKECAGSFVWQL